MVVPWPPMLRNFVLLRPVLSETAGDFLKCMFGWTALLPEATNCFRVGVSFRRLNTSPASVFNSRDALSWSQQSDSQNSERRTSSSSATLQNANFSSTVWVDRIPDCIPDAFADVCYCWQYGNYLCFELPILLILLVCTWTSKCSWKLVLSCTNCVSHPQRQAEQTWSLYQDDGHLKKQVDHGVNVSVRLVMWCSCLWILMTASTPRKHCTQLIRFHVFCALSLQLFILVWI